jgi:hypothetical protein
MYRIGSSKQEDVSMNAKKYVVAMLLVLPIALIGAVSASAQETGASGMYAQPEEMTVTFAFQAGDKTLPAGKYDIEHPTRELLIFRGAKGLAVEAPVITRLAQPSTPLVEPKIIFDKVGDTYYVSEVWLPNMDGFLLRGTKEAHTHTAVKAPKKKK